MAVNTVMQIKLQTESHLGNKEAVYEYFSPLGPEQESLRTASKKDFEEGIRCMEEKRFLEGRTLFVRALQANRDDLATGHYFRVCDGGDGRENYFCIRRLKIIVIRFLIWYIGI